MSWVYKVLLKLAGALIARYVFPLFSPEIRSALEVVTPIAERYMRAYITHDLPGSKKKQLVSDLVWGELKRIGKEAGIVQADVDQAIQLAYYTLGLDKAKRGAT